MSHGQILITILALNYKAVFQCHPSRSEKPLFFNALCKFSGCCISEVRTKEDNFFRPLFVAYEQGRHPVKFFTDDEEVAQAARRDLSRRYRREFPDIGKGRPQFIAPVVRIRTADGPSTYAIVNSYVSTALYGAVRLPKPLRSFNVEMSPVVPDSYEWTDAVPPGVVPVTVPDDN